ncbi:MAG: transposase, partial [Pseudomonadota bacterium]
ISTTLADWMIKGAERIVSPLLKTMEKTLYGNDYLHIDETILHTLNEEGWTTKHKSYIWYRATGGN